MTSSFGGFTGGVSMDVTTKNFSRAVAAGQNRDSTANISMRLSMDNAVSKGTARIISH